MAISDTDVEELLAALDRGRAAWISGQLGLGPGLDAEQDPDMTIFGPWGGEAGRGAGLPDRQKAMASLFHGGTGTSEVVKTIVSGDVVVVVLIERNEVTVEGRLIRSRGCCAPPRCSSGETAPGCGCIATPIR